MQLGLILYL